MMAREPGGGRPANPKCAREDAMNSSHTYLDHKRTIEQVNARDSKSWGSVHRAYALVVLAIGGVAAYQAKEMDLAIAVAILVATWSLVFQLIATTKLLHKSLTMIHVSQEWKTLEAPPNAG
jgi:hypothetical protein